MTHRDIVVIGASAGGVEALIALVRGLPADLPAAVFVVLHTPPYAVSRLPQILERSCPLPAAHAANGEPILPGRIYVAPPDRHLLLRPGHVALTRGPRENHARPAVDPLFRSAARAYGRRVVGVVLSGALYDGAAGLLAVKTRGGVAVVQDPTEAAVAGMPRSALRLVQADHVLPVAEIAPAIVRLSEQTVREGGDSMADAEERIADVIRTDIADQAQDGRPNELTIYTCPDCGGAMWQSEADPPIRFRCHVGHAYAPEVLIGQKSEELEGALWACVRLLTEKATLSRQLASRTRTGVGGEMAERIEEGAQLDECHAQTIRDLLESMPHPADQALVIGDTFDRRDGGHDAA
ncbi:MAG: chemotaxis protein CheB [Chloroflexota bacterium]|nr:chemotaxis protein CheB [Chloroflexota bacterium]